MSKAERFYIYVDSKKAAWVNKQVARSKISASAFFSALVEDKMRTDEDFCPSPTFVNLSSGDLAKKKS